MTQTICTWWTSRIAGRPVRQRSKGRTDCPAGGRRRCRRTTASSPSRSSPDMFNSQMRVEERTAPSRVAWTCVGGAEQWAGASIRFDLREHEAAAGSVFRQGVRGGARPRSPSGSTLQLGYYLESLLEYCKTGAGKPSRLRDRHGEGLTGVAVDVTTRSRSTVRARRSPRTRPTRTTRRRGTRTSRRRMEVGAAGRRRVPRSPSSRGSSVAG